MKIYEVKISSTLIQEGPAMALSNPDAVAAYMAGAFDSHPEQEQFWVILLNRKNFPKGRSMVTLGTATASLAHPREVFRSAILASAAAVICVHNHPSGDPAPSSADIQVTRQLREAGKVLGIDLLDHVIIGTKAEDPAGVGHYSFQNAGLL